MNTSVIFTFNSAKINNMKWPCIWLSFLLISFQTVLGEETANDIPSNVDAKIPKVPNEKVYAKLFLMRRKENKELLTILANEISYERRYKLIDAAYGKLLKILQETQQIIENSKYDPMAEKFPPKDTRLIDAITVTLDNICLFGEIILHFPDISYRALNSKYATISDASNVQWRDQINWCLKYSKYFYERIIDAGAQQLLSLVDQEINPDQRTKDYINPYRNSDSVTQTKNEHKKKLPKKLKRGPQLNAHTEL